MELELELVGSLYALLRSWVRAWALERVVLRFCVSGG